MMTKSNSGGRRYPIILKPPFMPMESAADYLIRVFYANGYGWNTQTWAANSIGRAELLSLSHGAAEAVSRVVGHRVDGIVKTTPSDLNSKTLTLNGEALHRDHWTTEDRRWCPGCWQDDLLAAAGSRPSEWNAHRRFWWNVAAISHCPIHSVRLQTACPHPDCGRPVLWYVGSLLSCQDGHSLLEGVSEVVPNELIGPDAYIVGRLGGMKRHQVPLLDQLPLMDAIEAMTRFGVAALGGPNLSMRAIRSAREAEMMAAGYKIATEWPVSFLDLLKAMPEKGSKSWGAEKRFGQLYKWARELPETEFGNEVRRVFFGHIGETYHVKSSSAVAAPQGRFPTLLPSSELPQP